MQKQLHWYYRVGCLRELVQIGVISELEKHKPVLVINIPHDSANIFYFCKAKELIELGQNETKQTTENKHIIQVKYEC